MPINQSLNCCWHNSPSSLLARLCQHISFWDPLLLRFWNIVSLSVMVILATRILPWFDSYDEAGKSNLDAKICFCKVEFHLSISHQVAWSTYSIHSFAKLMVENFYHFQFEISTLMNWISFLVWTGFLQTTQAVKIQFKLGKKQFIKIEISNWRISKIKCRIVCHDLGAADKG